MRRRLPPLRTQLPWALVLATLGLLGGSGTAQAAAEPATPPPESGCAPGEFCLWSGEFYGGQVYALDLREANPGECISLRGDFDGRSWANRMDRHVTVYQGRDCSTEGDFRTYPGGGTFVPQAPYMARGIQIEP
jgi:hypothetical protein